MCGDWQHPWAPAGWGRPAWWGQRMPGALRVVPPSAMPPVLAGCLAVQLCGPVHVPGSSVRCKSFLPACPWCAVSPVLCSDTVRRSASSDVQDRPRCRGDSALCSRRHRLPAFPSPRPQRVPCGSASCLGNSADVQLLGRNFYTFKSSFNIFYIFKSSF